MPEDKPGGAMQPVDDAPGSAVRRTVVVGGAALIATGRALIGTEAEAAADPKPEKLFTQPGDRFQFIKGDLKGQFLRPDMLVTDAPPIEVFPYAVAEDVIRRKNRLNRMLVLKLDTNEMDQDTSSRSVDGVLAYSALCTHRACTIKSWKAEERHLRCHCHLSEFAALSEGSVKSGPAKRQLPMVPLGLDEEGFVIATETFTRKPGGAKK